MTQVSKRIPFDDPNTLNLIRALYLGSNVIIAALYFYVQLVVNKKKGTHVSTMPSQHPP
ncbi:putative PHO88 (involved in phosphate transport) [Ilyonectria robusta]